MEIVERLKQGIRITEDPFGDLAREMNMEKDNIIEQILLLKKRGIIKGLRVLLDQKALGYKVNALVAMKMENCECEFFKNNQYISHFYKRKPDKDFQYNYYAMLHCPDEKCLEDFINYLKSNNIPYVVMRTLKNLKEDEDVYTHNDES